MAIAIIVLALLLIGVSWYAVYLESISDERAKSAAWRAALSAKYDNAFGVSAPIGFDIGKGLCEFTVYAIYRKNNHHKVAVRVKDFKFAPADPDDVEFAYNEAVELKEKLEER